jgi:hypothetical protein
MRHRFAQPLLGDPAKALDARSGLLPIHHTRIAENIKA